MNKNWAFSHIGIIVKDLDKAMAYYQTLGATVIDDPIELAPNPEGFKFHGKVPGRFKYRCCHLQLGTLEIEMHQPLEGESPWQEWLDRHGEGIDHINFDVEDVEKEAQEMVANGFPMVKSAVQPGNQWVSAYFDTAKEGGILTELSNKALIEEIGIKIGARKPKA